MFSEGNAANLVGCDSPLQIGMAIWRTFLKFEPCWVGRDSPLQIVMALRRASNGHYYLQRAIPPNPDHSAEELFAEGWRALKEIKAL